MSAATLEDAIKDLWCRTPALLLLVPSESVFIGFSTLRKLRSEVREIHLPLVLIGQSKILSEKRVTGIAAIVTQSVQVALAVTDRQQAHAMLATAKSTLRALCPADWALGKLMDLRPTSREEKQEPDGVWVLGQNFNALYTIT